MEAALVADVHVEDRPRHVALAPAPGLPGALGEGALGPVGVARVDAGAAAAAVVEVGGVLRAAGVAGAVRLVRARAVVARVAQEEHVAVGVGIVVRVVVGKAVRLGPGVLAVVGAGAAGDLGVAGVLVDVDDVGGVVGILVRQIEDVPRVGGGGGIGKPHVVVDDVVERQPQAGRVGGVHRVVVAGGWLRRQRGCSEQQADGDERDAPDRQHPPPRGGIGDHDGSSWRENRTGGRRRTHAPGRGSAFGGSALSAHPAKRCVIHLDGPLQYQIWCKGKKTFSQDPQREIRGPESV